MRRVLLTITLLAVAVSSLASTVYRWVDEQGVTHYSDQPHPGAEQLRVEGAQTVPAGTLAGPTRSDRQPAGAPSPRQGPSCAIVSPADDETLMNAWTVNGHVQVSAPVPGQRITLLLDGKQLPNAADPNGSFTIPEIDRGEHQLAALIQDSSGETVCQTPTITFHVRQPSVQAPNPASRPRF
jgi:hypothetical protein